MSDQYADMWLGIVGLHRLGMLRVSPCFMSSGEHVIHFKSSHRNISLYGATTF